MNAQQEIQAAYYIILSINIVAGVILGIYFMRWLK